MFQTCINVLAAIGVIAVGGSCVFLACTLFLSGRESRREEEMPSDWRPREDQNH